MTLTKLGLHCKQRLGAQTSHPFSAINLPSMPDVHDKHEQHGILHRIDDAIVPHADAVKIVCA